MKLFISTGILVLFSFCLSAQDQQANVSKSLLSAGIFLPGIEYETSLSKKTSLDVRLGTGFGYANGMARDEEWGIYLNFHSQYRYYYNFNRRLNKGRNTANNSANYFALNAGIFNGKPIIGDLETRADYSAEIGPVWGMQRIYNSGFKLDLHLGAGYAFNDLGESGLTPLIGFRLGWLILN